MIRYPQCIPSSSFASASGTPAPSRTLASGDSMKNIPYSTSYLFMVAEKERGTLPDTVFSGRKVSFPLYFLRGMFEWLCRQKRKANTLLPGGHAGTSFAKRPLARRTTVFDACPAALQGRGEQTWDIRRLRGDRFRRHRAPTPRAPRSPGVCGMRLTSQAIRGNRSAPLWRLPIIISPWVAMAAANNENTPQSARSERAKGGIGGSVARGHQRQCVISAGVPLPWPGDVSVETFACVHTCRRRAACATRRHFSPVDASRAPGAQPTCREEVTPPPKKSSLYLSACILFRFSAFRFPLPALRMAPAAARGRAAAQPGQPPRRE